MASRPYRFQSKDTGFYVTSTKEDADGQEVKTVDGKGTIPPNTVLFISVPNGPPDAIPELSPVPGVITITGVTGLYVSLKSDKEGTPLTWSTAEYKWMFKHTSPGSKTYYLIPAEGSDLYWVDELTFPPVYNIIVKAGKDIKPPESEWYIPFA